MVEKYWEFWMKLIKYFTVSAAPPVMSEAVGT